MQEVQLNVISREAGLKGLNKKLRIDGMVPANIYGPGVQAQPCAVQEKEIRKVFNNDFDSTLVLNLASSTGILNGKKVVLKGVERDPVTWHLTHADFYEIALDRPFSVKVPIHFEGTPEGVKNAGGILQIIRRTVYIRALPKDIPEFISIDISHLGLGDSMHISEVKFSEKFKVLDSGDYALVSIVEIEKEEVVAPTAVAADAAGTGAAAAAGTAAAPAEEGKGGAKAKA